jgi:hypothetical protein
MIRYDLVCGKGHEFDGWFRDSSAYDVQAKRGLVSCTVCGNSKIQKQIMAPSIPTKSNRRGETAQRMVAGPVDPRAAAMMQVMREFRKHVTENSEDVGTKFADEARKIHFKETKERSIYGVATPDDAKALIDEGIEVHPMPRLPEDGN